MNVDTLKKQAKSKISDSIQEVFKLLDQNLKEDTHTHNTFLAIKGAYKRAAYAEIQNIIDWETANRERSKCSSNLLVLIDNLDENDLDETSNETEKNVITKSRILVFVPDENREADIQKYFDKLPFGTYSICKYDETPNLKKFDLVVYDNRDLPSNKSLTDEQVQTIKQRTDFMEKCIEQNSVAIHFGNYLAWLNHNRDKAHAANSKFALFARIKEMLEFLEALE